MLPRGLAVLARGMSATRKLAPNGVVEDYSWEVFRSAMRLCHEKR